MGYSYGMRAGLVLDAIGDLVRAQTGGTSSNGMPDGGFWEETRKDRQDMAIVGTVWAAAGEGLVRKAGSFRIVRFPGLSKALKAEAERRAAAKFAEYHGTWRERAAGVIRGLREGAQYDYNWIEEICREWQREAKVMFAVFPRWNNPDEIRTAFENWLED